MHVMIIGWQMQFRNQNTTEEQDYTCKSIQFSNSLINSVLTGFVEREVKCLDFSF